MPYLCGIMEVLLIICSIICLVVGLIGCVAPMLPGTPLAYVGILLLHFTDKVEFSVAQLIVGGALVLLTIILDYIVPALGAKYAGGSKWGAWGCTIGTLIGMFFLPWGLLVGPFLGAVVGELLADRNAGEAIRSGLGSLLGFLFGTVLKLVVCFYFIYLAIAGSMA